MLFHQPAFRIVEFVCGVLAATAFLRGWVPALRVPWAAASVVVSYLAVLCLPALIGYRTEDRWALTLAMVPSFVVLIPASARADVMGAPSLLQRQTTVSLGEWSFCIYMSHPLVIRFAQPTLASAGVLGSLLGCVLVVFAVVGVSFVLHATLERPLERRLRGARDDRPAGATEMENSGRTVAQRAGRSVSAIS